MLYAQTETQKNKGVPLCYLYVLIPVSLILLVVANLNRPALIWNLPLWIHYHYTALTWGGILAIFAFVFSSGTELSL
jgi:hypothetical protein